MSAEILRYAAFTDTPSGGNPAGVLPDATGMAAADMLSVAARVGFSETAFVLPRSDGRHVVRYFSPKAEVPFCGHATIATAVVLAERHGAGDFAFETAAGTVPVTVRDRDGQLQATLTSVAPWVREAHPADVAEARAALEWAAEDLHSGIPPRVAYAGARHLVLPAATRERLADVRYDFERLRTLMEARDWTTVHLVWRQDRETFHARNLFPPGGVVEDPATGAAAAAFGAYLRELGLIRPPHRLTIHQGEDMGRPSRLLVEVPAGAESGIRVSGTAVPLD